MEVLKENISVNKRAAKESVQILLEGDIVLSDSKPDIKKILETNESTYIDSYEISNERLSFKGRADIEILYQAKGTDKKVQNMSADVDINDFINIDGIDEDMTAVVCCDVINADYELLNDRKIGYKIICQVTAEMIKNENTEIVKDIDGLDQSQIRKQKHTVNDIACCKEERFTIKDEIAISGGRPNIDEILSCRVSIGERNVKVGKDSAEISGVLRVSTLYRSDEEINVVNYIENEIP
ncbi:MAG: DUF3794 domain-containing protein, partial [Firmicutes bacterium]|nr:DUF3794 domain-containing protein [Bacillota bacterium]